MAWGNASRKYLTESTSYSSAPCTWGSRVGTRISQITRRPSLVSQRIITSASTSRTASWRRRPASLCSSALCNTASSRLRPAR
eukprot:1392449-Pleurochrysis_carterae.AAC.1